MKNLPFWNRIAYVEKHAADQTTGNIEFKTLFISYRFFKMANWKIVLLAIKIVFFFWTTIKEQHIQIRRMHDSLLITPHLYRADTSLNT